MPSILYKKPACVGFKIQIFVELLSDWIRVNLELQNSLLIHIYIQYMYM
jgi:hypothetical protein